MDLRSKKCIQTKGYHLLFSLILAIAFCLYAVPGAATCEKGIYNNGVYGITIDINSSLYNETWAKKKWAAPYLPDGCTWFVGARVSELTNNPNNTLIYDGPNWWNSYGESLGYKKGTALNIKYKAVVCWEDSRGGSAHHVAIIEDVRPDGSIILSEGGSSNSSLAPYGGCQIITTTDNDLRNRENKTFLGYIYLDVQVPSYDDIPPEISAYKDYSAGEDRITFAVKDNVAVDPATVNIQIWEYGQSMNESRTVTAEQYLNQTGFAVPDVYTAQVALKNKETIYYLRINATDTYGNSSYDDLGEFSFFPIDTSTYTGVYTVINDSTPIRNAPYAKINGKDTRGSDDAKAGDKVQVIGSYVNTYGNLWFLIDNNFWIYSENVEKETDLFGMLKELLQEAKIGYPIGYFFNSQYGTTTIITEAKKYTSANEFDNDVTRYDDGETIRLGSIVSAAGSDIYNETSGVPLHTITFNGNGGYVSETSIEIYEGNTYGKLPASSRFGYLFTGWYTEVEDGIEVQATDVCTQDLTLYAHWTESVSGSGICGYNLTWTLRSDGLLKIEGYGSMTSAPWSGWDSILEVSLSKDLTNIISSAFINCSNLKSISIPDSVTSIGSHAFMNCSNLKSISIPNSVTSIGVSALYGCSSLTSITVPNSVMSIGRSMFQNCNSLMNITIPNSVTNIETSAFQNCSSLTSITIPNSVTSIGGDAFYDCSNLASISIANSVNFIGERAFVNCSSLTSIIIPNRVSRINRLVFSGCSGLKSITIPDGVKSIDESAFWHCSSLTHITIPDSVTSIGNSAFSSCSSLTGFTIPEGVTNIENSTFYSCSSLASLVIPEGVTSIGSSALYGCSSLTNIVIPNSVTSIGDSAFDGCSSLASITIPDSVISIGSYAFRNCSSLTNMMIPNSVERIEGSVFDSCSSLVNITIPDSVTSIGNYAFRKCSSLVNITIPDSVTYLGTGVFYECISAENITLSAGATGIRDSSFCGCSNLTSITIPEGVTHIFDSVFQDCSSLTSISIPDSMMYIGSYAFRNCTNLKSISIPDSVTSIGLAALYGCSSLESIILPDNVTKISNDAFHGCSSLRSITIPDGVTSIGGQAFYYCSSLASIAIPRSLTSIGKYAFTGCSSLTSITIPASVASIGYYAFGLCDNLTEVYFKGTEEQWESVQKDSIGLTYATIHYKAYANSPDMVLPASITMIDSEAFIGLPSGTIIQIPATITSIADDAFDKGIVLLVPAGSDWVDWAERNGYTVIEE